MRIAVVGTGAIGVTFAAALERAGHELVLCARTPAEVAHARENAERLARDYGYDLIEPLDAAGLRALVPADSFLGGDLDRGGGHLHPLNLALGVARLAVAAGARVATAPSSGLRRSKTAPPSAGRRSPPMRMRMSVMGKSLAGRKKVQATPR